MEEQGQLKAETLLGEVLTAGSALPSSAARWGAQEAEVQALALLIFACTALFSSSRSLRSKVWRKGKLLLPLKL